MAATKRPDGSVHDPDTYRAMSEPFASATEGQAALDAFREAIQALRKEHHIRDVVVIVSYAALAADGTESEYMGAYQMGNQLVGAQLTAFAYGQERERLSALLARTVASGEKRERS